MEKFVLQKCRKDRRKKTNKLNKQISKETKILNITYGEVCSDKNKNEYDQCVNSIVEKKQTTDEFINSIKLNEKTTNSLKKPIGAAPGMRKRTNEVVYENPMYQQAGKRKKKSRRRKSRRRKSRRRKSRRK